MRQKTLSYSGHLQLRYQFFNNVGNDQDIYLVLCEIRKEGMRNVVMVDVQGVKGLFKYISVGSEEESYLEARKSTTQKNQLRVMRP